MPHCIIEHSKYLEIETTSLINAVYQGTLSSGLFEDDHIKTRILSYQHYQTGTLKKDFIHVTARILSGRTEKQRSMLSHSILSSLKSLNLSSMTLTVEIVEMESSTYSKKVL